MTKSIYQLLPDVRAFLSDRHELTIPITVRFGERKEHRPLRLSKLGEMCPKHLWYQAHHPELAEALPAEAIMKFSYGHTIEQQCIALAKAAGHEVTGEQDEVVVDGVKGHRDCVIDGYIVDVKSCSGRMFEKISTKALGNDDPFGYLAQLDGYMVGSADDDCVTCKDTAFIWAIDKVLGKMVLYEHKLRRNFILERIASYKQIVSSRDIPTCECGTLRDGESGNLRLDAKASYSPFKRQCHPGLRTFGYRNKGDFEPRFLTKVVRVPDVPELVDGRWV